eukprot:7386286-Prymnesium_polylepis.2
MSEKPTASPKRKKQKPKQPAGALHTRVHTRARRRRVGGRRRRKYLTEGGDHDRAAGVAGVALARACPH